MPLTENFHETMKTNILELLMIVLKVLARIQMNNAANKFILSGNKKCKKQSLNITYNCLIFTLTIFINS